MIPKKLNASDNVGNVMISALVRDLRQSFASFIMVADTLRHTKRDLPQEELDIFIEEMRGITLKSTGLLDGLFYWIKSQKVGFTYETEPLILKDLIREANGLSLYDQSCKSITIYTVIPER